MDFKSIGRKRLQFLTREDGVVSAEMVILFPLLALIVVVMVEVGHLWFVRQAIANASREGARAAVVYYKDPAAAGEEAALAARKTWAEARGIEIAKNYLQGAVPKAEADACPDPVIGWPDLTAASGNRLTVTVSSPNGLLLLNKFPFLKDNKFSEIGNLSAETTMRLE